MDELTDSESTMLTAASFNHILLQIQDSSLNYQLKITPFSAFISIKKSLVKDWDGQQIFRVDTKINTVLDLPNVDASTDLKVNKKSTS